MDPRLNPNLTPSQQPPLGQDVNAPLPQPTGPSVTASVPAQIETPPPAQPAVSRPAPTPEIVETIPVRQPGIPAAQPVQPQPPHTMTDVQPKKDEDELEQILQAVNNRVKSPQTVPAKKARISVKKPKLSFGGLRFLAAKPKIIITMAAATIVTVALIITAVIAYRQGSHSTLASQASKVGTSYVSASAIQQAGGVLVRPNDLDDFSQELQTKLNSLNDSQDFAAKPLSDQMLGL